jgi:hypothetical protein
MQACTADGEGEIGIPLRGTCDGFILLVASGWNLERVNQASSRD